MRRPLRLLRLWRAIFVVSAQRDLAYRGDFAAQLIVTGLALAGTLVALAAVYAQVRRLAGWDLNGAVMLIGTYLIVNGLHQAFVEPNVVYFAAAKVRTGALDDLLLKPVSSLFLASLGTCRPAALIDTVMGTLVVTSGLLRAGTVPTPGRLFAWFALVAVGATVSWSSRIALASCALYANGLELGAVYSTVWQLGRYPVDVYGPTIRGLLTYAIPLAFISSLPARALSRGASSQLLIGGLLAASCSTAVAAIVWRRGLRHYTSATT